MTQEKRIRIAEACGWKLEDVVMRANGKLYRGYFPDIKTVTEVALLPDYFNDLNACHDMEKTLRGDDWTRYVDFISDDLVRAAGYQAADYVIRATASQRAEAFGKTLGLW